MSDLEQDQSAMVIEIGLFTGAEMVIIEKLAEDSGTTVRGVIREATRLYYSKFTAPEIDIWKGCVGEFYADD